MVEELIFEDLDEKYNPSLLKYFTSPSRSGYVKCKGCILPQYFKNIGEKIQKLDIQDDDIWVCTFPKTGTTWTQEMVWCIANNLNFEAADETLLHYRFPFLEISMITGGKKKDETFEGYVNTFPSPRFIKSHLPFDLLPLKLRNNSTSAKIIYVTRNARDTCISYYHHCKSMEGFKGSFEQFVDLFLKGDVTFGPFFNHLKSYLEHKTNPNILFLKYEDMKTDLKTVIHRTANFLNKTIDEDGANRLLHHLSFSEMKQNKAVNYEGLINELSKVYTHVGDFRFMRKGRIGEWKETMDSTLCERFEKWEEENLKNIDFANFK